MSQLIPAAAIRQHLAADGLIAYPTEGVWGLGCNPASAVALQKLIQLKGRHADKGLILIGSRFEQLDFVWPLLEPEQMATLQQAWPGFVTYVLPLPRPSPFPVLLTGSHARVAVRLSAHPLVQQLCDALGLLVSTSANPAGQPPAMTTQQVRDYFGDQVMIIDGALGTAARPSAIIDLMSGQVLRAG